MDTINSALRFPTCSIFAERIGLSLSFCCNNQPPAKASNMHIPAATEYHIFCSALLLFLSGFKVWVSSCICFHSCCHSSSGSTCWPYSFCRNAIRFVITSSNTRLFVSSCSQLTNSSSNNRSGSRSRSRMYSIFSCFSSIFLYFLLSVIFTGELGKWVGEKRYFFRKFFFGGV